MTRKFLIPVTLLLLTVATFASDKNGAGPMVISWPSDSSPVVRLTFAKFNEAPMVAGHKTLTTDVEVENTWGHPIRNLVFSLYLFDKAGARIGEAVVAVTNLSVDEKAKMMVYASTIGSPATFRLVAQTVPSELRQFGPAHAVSYTAKTIPTGASLFLDGRDTGPAPKTLQVSEGHHTLAARMDGYTASEYSFDIGPDDGDGGGVTLELGSLSRDTLELRDGTSVSGDLIAVTANDVQILVGGKKQTYERNLVKRILLVQRVPVGS